MYWNVIFLFTYNLFIAALSLYNNMFSSPSLRAYMVANAINNKTRSSCNASAVCNISSSCQLIPCASFFIMATCVHGTSSVEWHWLLFISKLSLQGFCVDLQFAELCPSVVVVLLLILLAQLLLVLATLFLDVRLFTDCS